MLENSPEKIGADVVHSYSVRGRSLQRYCPANSIASSLGWVKVKFGAVKSRIMSNPFDLCSFVEGVMIMW
jgi:hypothetical protein